MEVSFLQLAKSNLAAYLDSQQKDIRKDSRKDGDDIPRHSSLIAEADPVVHRAMGEFTKPVVHRGMADDDEKSLKARSAGGAMKKLKKKLKAETKISDAHDRIDEMKDAKKKLKKKQKADEKKEAAEKRKDNAERRKEAEQEEEGEDKESSDAQESAGTEKSAVSDAISDRVAARKAEHEKMLQQRQAGKDLMKEQKEARAQQKKDAKDADMQQKEALKVAKESGAVGEASEDEGSRMVR